MDNLDVKRTFLSVDDVFDASGAVLSVVFNVSDDLDVKTDVFGCRLR